MWYTGSGIYTTTVLSLGRSILTVHHNECRLVKQNNNMGYQICQFAGLINSKRITVNMILILFLAEATVIDFKHGLVEQIQTKSFVS